MWAFQGVYTGAARAYIQEKRKKETILWAAFIAVMDILLSLLTAFMFGAGNAGLWVTLFICVMCVTVTVSGMILFLFYRQEPKCGIKIENGGFQVYTYGNWQPLAFYKIKEIVVYDDFIAVENFSRFKVALQKDLLMEGDWEELKALLTKVEDSLDTDEPMYQIDEPETECFQATVQSKRIYEQFVNGVSWTTRVGVFQYFATFSLGNGEEAEYEIGQEVYERIEEGKTGLLVLTGGNFFTFDNEEDEGSNLFS